MSNTPHSGLRLPAEWEPQSAIQLTWPHAGTDWKPYLDDITRTFVGLAKEIVQRQKLLIVTPEEEAVRRLLGPQISREAAANLLLAKCDTNDTWARDHAPLTLTAEDAEGSGGVRLLDFKFNGWGEKFGWQKDNAISRRLYREGLLNGVMEDHTDFVLEGGAVESDGRGTVMTTTSCLLAPHRNQPLTRKDIERRLLESLRAERVIWIDHGQLEGDDTDGHIDTLVRMAPDDTLVYVGCDDTADTQYAGLKAMEEQLATLATTDGRPYRLLKLPMPRAVYDEGGRLPATYANFVILNGAVIVPTYGQPDNDAEAMEVIGKAFPDRETVGLDASTVIRQHGSLHCLTMQYPLHVV